MTALTQSLSGAAYDTGFGRTHYEDRVRVETLRTAGGLALRVALVADGVGGENRGERAAQLAVDAFLASVSDSVETDGPRLLSGAVRDANHAVLQEKAATEGASCTLAAAVIVNEKTLYVANVGDSRVYLLRNGRLTQLTLDHTFANLMPVSGKMSPAAARANPRAGVLVRSLGSEQQPGIDLGFHIGDTTSAAEYQVAQERGRRGLPLKKGDAVLVCSDGLTQPVADGGMAVQIDEIIECLTTQEGERAARALVSFAVGRRASDNVSAAVLQTARPEAVEMTARGWRGERRRLRLVFGAVLLVLLVVAGLIIRTQVVSVDRTQAQATAEALAARERQTRLVAGLTADAEYETRTVAEIIAAFTATPTGTPTPSPTPFIPPEPGQIAVAFFPGERRPIRIQDLVEAGNTPLQVQVNHRSAADFKDGSIYGTAGTRLQIQEVDSLINLVLFEDSDILLETGDYKDGALINLVPASALRLFVAGSCLGVDYDATQETVALSCFAGRCSYSVNFERAIAIPQGSLALFDLDEMMLREQGALPQAVVARYDGLLRSDIGGDGIADADTCLVPYLPTPTPTPSPTRIVVPTRTPQATATAGPYGGSGSGAPPPPTGLGARSGGAGDGNNGGPWIVTFLVLAMIGMAIYGDTVRRRAVPARAAVDFPTGRLLLIGLSFVALVAYGLTLATGVVGYDSAELTTGAYTLGIVHPSGYPLFLLLGKLFAQLPLGSVAARINFMTALWGALTIGVTGRIIWQITDRALAAAVGALLLAFATVFWEMSVVAEVYTLNTLLTAAALSLLLDWRKSGSPRLLAAAGLCFSLGLANHLSIVFFLPLVIILVWSGRRTLTTGAVVGAALATALPLLLYLYLPWRSAANPALNYVGRYYDVDLQTWRGLFWMISGAAYHMFAGGYDWPGLVAEMVTFGAQLGRSFGAPALIWGAIGAVWLLWRQRTVGLALAAAALAHTAFYVNYNVVDKYTMFLPVYLIWGVLAGCGVSMTLQWMTEWAPKAPGGRRWLPAALICAPLLVSLWLNWGIVDRRTATPDADRALAIMDTAPPQAVLVADWSTAVILEYLQLVERRRPDVEIVNRSRFEVATYYRHWRVDGAQRLTNDEILVRVDEQTTALLASYAPRPIYLVNTAAPPAGGYVGAAAPVAAPLLQPYAFKTGE